ncbi:hypothetical protein [Streptomyces massasporeus]|uniref:hypothetical protein n=1 Tax=Streptomyces massasporeus TaxID=67324 RepID=UPI0016729676|nr:hypothetical protein [Streptomyces massasporeus]
MVIEAHHHPTRVRGRAYDVVAHQQAAMPEQLLAPRPPPPSATTRSRRPDAGRRST